MAADDWAVAVVDMAAVETAAGWVTVVAKVAAQLVGLEPVAVEAPTVEWLSGKG